MTETPTTQPLSPETNAWIMGELDKTMREHRARRIQSDSYVRYLQARIDYAASLFRTAEKRTDWTVDSGRAAERTVQPLVDHYSDEVLKLQHYMLAQYGR